MWSRVRICFAIAVALLLLSVPARGGKLLEYRDSVKSGYNFLLYVPESYSNGCDSLPVILFLHGRSLSGSELSMVTRYGCIDALRRGRELDALVICPQCRTGNGWEAAKVMNVVDWVRERYASDENRLYVFGMSMGGWGTFKMVSAYPDKVAAAVALCGGFLGDVAPMTDVPIWIIHGTADDITAIHHSKSIVSKMEATGKATRLRYTWLQGCDHSILARAFLLEDPYKWLLSHSLAQEDRPMTADYDMSPSDLNSAYMHLDTSKAQKLPIQKP